MTLAVKWTGDLEGKTEGQSGPPDRKGTARKRSLEYGKAKGVISTKEMAGIRVVK